MTITQISVYLENARGALRALTKTLADAGIDLLALSVADTESFGIVRIVVREKDFETAMNTLRENGFMAKKNHVFCVAVPNRPAGLDSVLAVIDGLGVSVEYMYSFNYNIEGSALMILRLSSSDREALAAQLTERGVRLIGQESVNVL